MTVWKNNIKLGVMVAEGAGRSALLGGGAGERWRKRVSQ